MNPHHTVNLGRVYIFQLSALGYVVPSNDSYACLQILQHETPPRPNSIKNLVQATHSTNE